jgi:hypothetical protein
MKKSIIVPLLFILLISVSCVKESHITLNNKIGLVKIENVSFDNIKLTDELITGETQITTINEGETKFPKRSQVSFYMIKGASKVYLKTKQNYTLDYSKTLIITLNDTTEVYNP